jgi:hypothetical protein
MGEGEKKGLSPERRGPKLRDIESLMSSAEMAGLVQWEGLAKPDLARARNGEAWQ